MKSAARVLRILECFGTHRRPLAAAEVQARLRLPQSSTIALLKSLLNDGYLSFDPESRRYFVTPRVTTLGDWADDHFFGARPARRMLTELQRATGHSVALVCCARDEAVVVRVAPGASGLAMRSGGRLPMWPSAPGLVFLAFMAPAEVDAIRERLADGLSRVQLDREIQAVRRRGHALVADRPVHGVAQIAAPLRVRDAATPMCLCVVGPTHRLLADAEPITRALRYAVAQAATAGAAPAATSQDYSEPPATDRGAVAHARHRSSAKDRDGGGTALIELGAF